MPEEAGLVLAMCGGGCRWGGGFSDRVVCGPRPAVRPIQPPVSGHHAQPDRDSQAWPRRGQAALAARCAGWAFLVAGLTLVAAAMLVPAWRELDGVRRDHSRLAAQVDLEARRLAATLQVRDSAQRRDPELTRRLIAWQLNHVPAGDTAFVREVHADGVLGWIDDAVAPNSAGQAAPPVSRLEGLVTGPPRLWVLGGGSMLVFVGLIGFASPVPRMPRKSAVPA